MSYLTKRLEEAIREVRLKAHDGSERTYKVIELIALREILQFYRAELIKAKIPVGPIHGLIETLKEVEE